MADMTDLDAIRARAEAATPGPWEIKRSMSGYPYQIHAPNGSKGPGGVRNVTRWGAISVPSLPEGEANAQMLAHAREDIPALLALIDEQQAEIERLQAIENAREERRQRAAEAVWDRHGRD